MAVTIEWLPVHGQDRSKIIGSVGFVGSNPVAVVAYFDDYDPAQTGKRNLKAFAISKAFLDIKGISAANVAGYARGEPEIAEKGPNVIPTLTKVALNFTAGLITQGLYHSYLATPGVDKVAAVLAKPIAKKYLVKDILVQKGLEQAVQSALLMGSEVTTLGGDSQPSSAPKRP